MNALGIYVHWPYCTAICPYCDFNVYRARGADTAALIDAIARDLAAHAARFGKREAVSLFFGGGTPSLLRGAELARLIEAANAAFPLAADCEITLEANPEDHALFAEQAGAGINRFSIGAQALDDAALQSLGRMHDARTALTAVDAAAATGKRVSLDLIYARERQSITAWGDELRRALALPVEHLSLYQLTIEPGTAFDRRVTRGDLSPPDSDLAASLYEATQDICDAAGFPAYEISNHARGAAACSRHNTLYWKSQDWVGVGPGAHGRGMHAGVRVASEAHRRPADYVDAVNACGFGWSNQTELTGEERADEMLLMGMRLAEGVELGAIEALRGRRFDQSVLEHFARLNLLIWSDTRVVLTPAGRLVMDRIVRDLSA